MKITKLKLKNFRNHLSKDFVFSDGQTIIIGPNGSGKSNILEAIYLLATAKSARAKYDRDLVNHAKDFCAITGTIVNTNDLFELELQIIKQDTAESNTSSKKVKVNKVPKTIVGFTGIFNAVLFTPEDLQIVSGSPAERRRFLDLLLSQVNHDYKRALMQYTKTVRQRNKILEQINETNSGYSQLSFWDEQLLKFSVPIHKLRNEFIDYSNHNLSFYLKKLYSTMDTTRIEYKSSLVTEERLGKYRDREIAAKSTLVGPHREDFEIILNNYNIGEFGSRGQQRTIILTLRLMEIGFIEKIKGERPILLLDDIFSELDEKHREAVLELVAQQQTIITSAEPEAILKNISGTTILLKAT